MKFEKLTKIEALKYNLKMLLKIWRAHYIRKQKKIRTRDIVKRDYNDDSWLKILESKYWRNAKDLLHFTNMTMPYSNLNEDEKLICLINGQLVRITLSDIDDYSYSRHCDILARYISDNEEIVELGCGFGLALFSFRSRGLDNPMWGYDVSENATSAAKEINEHFNGNLKFGIVDLSKPFDGKFLSGKTVFTSSSFEQLRHYTEVAIKSIISGRPKQVIHFEPVPELLGWNLLDIVAKAHNEFADYQNNLLSTLKKFEKQKILKILNVERLGYGSNPYNEITCIRWKPV